MYADIGQTTFNQQKHLLPGIPDLDDTPTEYAKINHNASVKPLKSQKVVKNNGEWQYNYKLVGETGICMGSKPVPSPIIILYAHPI